MSRFRILGLFSPFFGSAKPHLKEALTLECALPSNTEASWLGCCLFVRSFVRLSTVNLVSHVHEHAKLWASIATLVEQIRRWYLHLLVAIDLN